MASLKKAKVPVWVLVHSVPAMCAVDFDNLFDITFLCDGMKGIYCSTWMDLAQIKIFCFAKNFEKLFSVCVKILIKSKVQLSGLNHRPSTNKT